MKILSLLILILLIGLFFQAEHQVSASCTTGMQCVDLNQIPSPLKQFMTGVAASDVKCSQSFQLILKVSDGSPACVTSQTAQRLVDRGWGTLISQITQTSESSHMTSTNCQMLNSRKIIGVGLLYMPVNSTGKICAQYSNFNAVPVPATMEIYNAKGLSSATGVSILPSDVMVPPGNSIIVYTIKTGNQTGFYSLGFFCTGIPLSVGNDPKTVTSDDFPWLGQTFYCGVQMFKFQIIGLDGVGLKYVPNP